MADTKKSPKASSKPESTSVKGDKKAAVKKDQPTGAKKGFAKVKQFFKDVRGETKKIVWNSRADTVKNTGVVLMVTVIVGAGVWVCDLAFRELVELVYSLAGNGGAEAAMIAVQNLANLF